MSNPSRKQPPRRGGAQWKKLARQFPASPHLKSEVLFALPALLVECISRQAPSVLTVDDIRFETELRRLSATGFYRRQPMFSELLDGHLLDSDEVDSKAITQRTVLLNQRRETRLRDVLSSNRPQEAHFDLRERIRRDIDQDIDVRLRGYAGWLATHPAYWEDVCTIRFLHQNVLDEYGEYPALTERFQEPFLPTADTQLDRRDAIAWIQRLQSRWGLASFTTFAIPAPLRPGIWTGDRFDPGTIVPDGLSLFLPWPMLVDGWITVQRLIEFHRTKTDSNHLAEWLEDSNALGVRRCGRILELFVYCKLALSSRYSDAMKGQSTPLNRAFAAYFEGVARRRGDDDRGVESVRKLRQILHRRLKACEEAWRKRIDELEQGQIEPPAEAKRVASLLQSLEADVAAFRSKTP